jgi:hypothetical protein
MVATNAASLYLMSVRESVIADNAWTGPFTVTLLSDLGMLEDGMTTDDKRNLWAVIKRSQDTAKAEEQNRQKQARQALKLDQVTINRSTQHL